MSIQATSLKDIASATLDTIKQNPIKSILKIAVIVAVTALSVLLIVGLATTGPLTSIPLIITGAFCSILNPPLYTYGLFHQSIKDALFAQFKKNHTIDKISNSEVVLVLESTEAGEEFKSDQRYIFQELEKKYAVAVEKISTVEDISQSIDKVLERDNKIKAIWFKTYCNPSFLYLSRNHFINGRNVSLLEQSLKKIDEDGTIILDNGSAGDTLEPDLNIAQRIAQIAEGRAVIASSIQWVHPSAIMLEKKNPLNVTFWSPLESETEKPILRSLSRLISMIKYALFIKTKFTCNNFAFNSTKVYRYSV